MILLDPDLDPYPAPAIAARRALPAQPPASRLPSTRSLANFLRIAQAAVRLRGQVTVLLTTDRAIRKLNREFRNIDKATDVLSFPAEFPGVAGDLAIGVPTAFQQASEEGHSLGVEVKVLMLHGLLHLAGYDHEVDEGRMGRRERLLRARLGLPQGLIERNEGDGLQPVRRRIRNAAALAADGRAGFSAKSPSGAKAPAILGDQMYGLKPVPSWLKSAPSRDKSLSRVAGAKARVDSHGSMRGLKPPPPSGSTARGSGRVPQVSILRPGKPRISSRAPSRRSGERSTERQGGNP